jgi:diadenylate cyclase
VLHQLASLLRRPAISWWDILDILVVAVVVYEALKLIRGTRAVQMALGSFMVIVLFFLSGLLPLQTVNWLIRNMLVYVAFAAIVIFQSDIRRALAHLGRAPFFRYFASAEAAEEAIAEIVVAAQMLSAQRVGAIIIVEREIGLRNYIESGIPLDATLTYDLLVTIFQPGSPVHDGAAIVQENRIAAAACFLPLTVNPKVGRELGTDTRPPSARRATRLQWSSPKKRGRFRWRSRGISSAASGPRNCASGCTIWCRRAASVRAPRKMPTADSDGV